MRTRQVGRWLLVPLILSAAPLAAAVAPWDEQAWRDTQTSFVDLYNGGLNGRSGFEVYSAPQTVRADWNGWIQPLAQRDFTKPAWFWNWDNHVIGQSRGVYINAEAARALGPGDSRFREATRRSADYLLSTSWDRTHGGFFWGAQGDAANPPTSTQPVWGPMPTEKDAYGQVHAVFSLAHAYGVTQDPRHLQGALDGWQQFKTRHADPAYPGGYVGGFVRDYSAPISGGHGRRNLDYMCHAYEALLALSDVTVGATRDQIVADARSIGEHIVRRMVRDEPASWDPVAQRHTRAYIPWYYNDDWSTASDSGTSPGHQFEYAYLLSRGVERGIGDASWLDAAEKLMTHTLRYGWDAARGTVNQDSLSIPGFNGGSPEVIWWPNAEAARMFAHFVVVRGRDDLADELALSLDVAMDRFVDPVYGGWFASLNPTTLAPSNTSLSELKTHPWKAGYHVSMLYAEMIRLSAIVPEPGAALLGVAAIALLRRRPR